MNRCIEPIFEREEEMYMVDYLLCRFRNDASHDHQANFSSLLDYVCWEGEEEDSPRLLANHFKPIYTDSPKCLAYPVITIHSHPALIFFPYVLMHAITVHEQEMNPASFSDHVLLLLLIRVIDA